MSLGFGNNATLPKILILTSLMAIFRGVPAGYLSSSASDQDERLLQVGCVCVLVYFGAGML